MWRLANSEKQPGALDDVKRFLDAPSKISAYKVAVPLETNDAVAAGAVGGLASAGIRSMELWWDGQSQQLDFVIAAGEHNIEPYKQAFSIMYPQADFIRTKNTEPEWYNEREPYHYWDVSWRHGHFAGTIEDVKWFSTHLASAIQINKHAWIQAVWCTMDLSAPMMRYADAFEAAKAANKDNPEFARNAVAISNDIQNKTQGPHVVLSVRGLCNFGAAEWDSDYSVRSVQAIGGRSLEEKDGNAPCDELYTVSDNNNNKADGTDGIGILPFEGVENGYDYLVKNRYFYSQMWQQDGNTVTVAGKNIERQRAYLFPGRLLPDPAKTLKKAISHYTAPNLMGRYRDRAALPYMILKPPELFTFVKLPDPKTAHIQTTRNQAIPTISSDKKGYNMGFFHPTTAKMSEEEYYSIFGRPVVSADADAVVVSHADFAHHIYAPGATGSGKSSIIKCFAKHLEMGNIYAKMPRNKTVAELRDRQGYDRYLYGLDGAKTLDELELGFENAFIYFDPKGDDSEMFVRMCEPTGISGIKVRYLDPIKTSFALNPLELPPYDSESRDSIVGLYVGHFVSMVQAWYGDSPTFVRLQRILRVFVQFLYQDRDNPTLLDMYNLVRLLHSDPDHIKVILDKEARVSSAVLDDAMRNIAGLKSDAFEPLLNRLEPFATDVILNRIFCVKNSTVLMRDLIVPGSYTVVRCSKSDIPAMAIKTIMQTFVLHLWYAIEDRSKNVSERDRSQVVLALDEFQELKEIDVLNTMIEQARSKGLGLILSHQNLKQLHDDLLSKITGNFGVQMAGRLEGGDAGRIGTAWDPKYKNHLMEQIAIQPKWRWTANSAAAPGKEQMLPVQFWTHFHAQSGGVLKSNMTDREWKGFCSSEKKAYTPNPDDIGEIEEHDMWLKNIEDGTKFVKKIEWVILLSLLSGPQNLLEITHEFDGLKREAVSEICANMLEDGLLEKDKQKYSLSDSARTEWFEISPASIGRSQLGAECIGKGVLHDRTECSYCRTRRNLQECMGRCVQHHLSKKHFIAMASQKFQRGKDCTDLVAYDYEKQESISIEIESDSEVQSHPEHIVKNMTKWPELYFDRCEIWSLNSSILEIYGDQMEREIKKQQRDLQNNVHILDKVKICALDARPDGPAKDAAVPKTELKTDPSKGLEGYDEGATDSETGTTELKKESD